MNNQSGDENGPISGQVFSGEWDPKLLTVGQTAPGGAVTLVHEGNCDLVVREGLANRQPSADGVILECRGSADTVG
jgi:hypothetical protein